MAYASTSNVAAYCRNLISPSSNFSSATEPTDTEVNVWLSTGCAFLESKIAECGYGTPAPSGTAAYDILMQLNTYYAVAQAELSRINVTVQPGERTRGQVFMKMFEDGKDNLCEVDLTALGLSQDTSGGTIYAAGVTVSDRDSIDGDTSLTKPRFKRDLYRFPSTIYPEDASAS